MLRLCQNLPQKEIKILRENRGKFFEAIKIKKKKKKIANWKMLKHRNVHISPFYSHAKNGVYRTINKWVIAEKPG